MAAGVHHADLLAAEFSGLFGLKRQAGTFGDRQRIHVGAQGDALAGLAAFEHGDDAGVCDTGGHFQAEAAQMFGNAFRRPELAVAELGELMEIAAPFQHLGINRLGPGFDIDGVCSRWWQQGGSDGKNG